MLGLGLAVTVGKRILGGVIESLMSALRGRADYSENNTDSKAVVKDIDNYELLDKATILLTPTATSDARVHSVKTYTGELVTNGTFDTDSDWTKGTGITIGGGVATFTSTPSGQSVGQNAVASSLPNGAYAKVTFEVLSRTEGSFGLYFSGTLVGSRSSVGVFTAYFTKGTETSFYIRALGTTSGTISNVSVVDVSSDFDFDRASSATRINSSGLVQDMQSITDPELILNGDFEELGDELVTNGTFDTDSGWTKGTGWSIANGKASCDGNQASDTLIYENIGDQSNETIKFSFTVSDYVSGTLKTAVFGASGTTVHSITSNGDYTFYIDVASGHNGNTGFKAEVGFQGSIDNVSVQQVDPNDRWTLSSTFEIDNGKLHCVSDGSYQYAYQGNAFVVGRTYKITFDVLDYTSGSIRVRPSGQSGYTAVSANGTYTQYFTATDTTLAIERDSACDLYVDNVSIKDITFSTDVDLARINYDSNGDNGHILLEPTSTNLFTYSEDFENQWTAQSGITITNNTTETTSPSGEYNAAKVVSTNNTRGFYKLGLSITTDATRTIYLKGSVGGESVTLKDGSGFGSTETYSLTTDWVRYELKTTADGNTYQGLFVDDISVGTIYAWGAQIEELSHSTSYIPTLTGSTVTRATETLTGSGNSTLINSTEGVLYAEIAALDNDQSERQISIDDGSGNNRIILRYNSTSNNINAYLFNGSLQGGEFNHTLTDITSFIKVAFKWKVNDFALWVNGVEVGSDSSGTTFSADTLNDISFDFNGLYSFYGKCKALAVFDEALEDDELELLTGVTNYGSFGELASANGYTII